MQTLGMILNGVGALIAVVGGIWLLVVAFQESIGWGIGCLLCAPVAIVFAIMNWEKAKKPFLIELGGALLAGIGTSIAYSGAS
jgi:hypothetical protein